jgi:small ligand-binding sensory domain FIST
MRWSSTVIGAPDALDDALDAFGRAPPPDVILAFASAAFAPLWPQLPGRIRSHFPSTRVLGCSAGGVIGGGREIENAPGLSLLAGWLPGVRITPFSGRQSDDIADAPPPPDALGALILAEPFGCDLSGVLGALHSARPACQAAGGVASGAMRPGQSALFLDDHALRTGFVGLAFAGELAFDALVAQGSRPIGPPLFVTDAHGPLVRTLDGKRGLDTLDEVLEGLDDADRALAQRALLVGLVMDPTRHSYGPGDFLVRSLVGIEPESGHLLVAGDPQPNQVLQFHVRDDDAARADLEAILGAYAPTAVPPPAGALMFTCLSRGEQLFGFPGHDSARLRAHLGDLPVGGFFANGEVGPIDGRPWLHGFTTVFALFRPRAHA